MIGDCGDGVAMEREHPTPASSGFAPVITAAISALSLLAMNPIILKSLSVAKEILREKLGTTNAHELYE